MQQHPQPQEQELLQPKPKTDISPSSPVWGQLDKVCNDAKLAIKAGGFTRVIRTANGIATLTQLLDDEVMRPVMYMQSRSIGFLTDKDRSGGYPVHVVRDAIIEASMLGLNVCGNQFNIISGRMYVSKNGCKQLLDNLGVRFSENVIIDSIDGKEAKISYLVDWYFADKGADSVKKECHHLTALVHSTTDKNGNQFTTSTDALLGKATRKGRMWLYNKITNLGLVDAEAEVDATFRDVSDTTPPPEVPKMTSRQTRRIAAAPREETPAEDPEQLLREKCMATPFTTSDIKRWCDATGEKYLPSYFIKDDVFRIITRRLGDWMAEENNA